MSKKKSKTKRQAALTNENKMKNTEQGTIKRDDWSVVNAINDRTKLGEKRLKIMRTLFAAIFAILSVALLSLKEAASELQIAIITVITMCMIILTDILLYFLSECKTFVCDVKETDFSYAELKYKNVFLHVYPAVLIPIIAAFLLKYMGYPDIDVIGWSFFGMMIIIVVLITLAMFPKIRCNEMFQKIKGLIVTSLASFMLNIMMCMALTN